MKLLVVSYKACFPDDSTPGQYVTSGGFPLQMEALSELFSETRLLILEGQSARPSGAMPLVGRGLSIDPLPEPQGSGWVRKLRLIPWSVRNLRRLWKEVVAAEAVHCLVPGDLGFLGLLISLSARKRVFVRHCGTWGIRDTWANRLLGGLLRRIAGGRIVVMATGGGMQPPEPLNPAVTWIFSTSLRAEELDQAGKRSHWRGGPLRLITVGRLSQGKNARACIDALPTIMATIPGSSLDIVGDGPERKRLEDQAAELSVSDSVRFHGDLSHEKVMQTLQKSDLFLFPTRVAEGFPKAVLEALACGLPVVAPQVSVLPLLVGQRRGVLLEGTDATDVAEAVLRCAADPDQLEAMGENARQAVGEYTLERWQDQIRERLEAAWGVDLLSPLDGKSG